MSYLEKLRYYGEGRYVSTRDWYFQRILCEVQLYMSGLLFCLIQKLVIHIIWIIFVQK